MEVVNENDDESQERYNSEPLLSYPPAAETDVLYQPEELDASSNIVQNNSYDAEEGEPPETELQFTDFSYSLPGTMAFARNLECAMIAASLANKEQEEDKDENFNDESQDTNRSGPLLSYH